jgi:hypothetical protein
MRCRFGLRVIEYAALFETPLFGLAKRQTDVLEACFRRTEQSFPLELGDLRAPGGETYADLVAAVRYPRLRGAVEVRVDRLTGRFEGLASKEEADQSMLFLSQCQQAVNDVFPDLLVASTSMNVMSWLSCEGDSHAVEELLAARQHVQLDAAAAGAERARFFVRGQLVNDADGWSVSFGLEPSVLRDYGLYFICQGNYIVSGTYPLISDQDTHLGKLAETVLHQFGFEATG